MNSTLLSGKKLKTQVQQQTWTLDLLHHYIVYFYVDPFINLLFCTGSLFLETTVITSANCVYDFLPVHFSGVRVVLGSSHLTTTPKTRKIVQVHYYPGYDDNKPSYTKHVAIAKVSIILNCLNHS